MDPLYFVPKLDFQGIVVSSLLFVEVASDNGDDLRWKVKNLDPIDGVVF